MKTIIETVIEKLNGKAGNNLNLQSAAAREKLATEIVNELVKNQHTQPPTP